MATYVRGYSIRGVVDIHKLFAEAIALATEIDALARRPASRLPRTPVRLNLERAYVALNRDLEDLARTSARQAETQIRADLAATARRPDTQVTPHLRDVIKCRPLRSGIATGQVGVADVAWLDRAVNPNDPRREPYWMAQEYGSTAALGRVLKGYFMDGGHSGPRAPAKGAAGQPIFASTRSAAAALAKSAGVPDGFGTIRNPIRARHFIRDGATHGFFPYIDAWRAIEARAVQAVTRAGM